MMPNHGRVQKRKNPPVKIESDAKKPTTYTMSNEEVEQNLELGLLGTIQRTDTRAQYWTTFEQVVDLGGTRMPFIQCRDCKKVMKRAENAGSQAYVQHMNKCPGVTSGERTLHAASMVKNAIDDVQLQATPSPTPPKTSPSKPTAQQASGQRIAVALSRFCYAECVPISSLTGTSFLALINSVLSEYAATPSRSQPVRTFPSAAMVLECIKNEAVSHRQLRAEELNWQVQNHGGAFTFDLRKEPITKYDFITGTYHFIDTEWKLRKRVLFCAEVPPNSDSPALVFDQMQRLGLKSARDFKDVYIVMDFASDFGVSLSGKLDGHSQVGSSLEEVKSVLTACVDRKNAPVNLDRLLDALAEHSQVRLGKSDTSIDMTAVNDGTCTCKVGWIINFVDNYITAKEMLVEMFDGILSTSQLEEVHRCLAPFVHAIRTISRQNDVTAHLVAPYFVRIKTSLEKNGKASDDLTDSFRAHLLTVVENKLLVDEIHKMAVFFNPAMKKLALYPRSEADAVVASVRAMLPATETNPTPSKSVPPSTMSSDTMDFSEFEEYSETNGNGTTGSVVDELEYYLASRAPPPGFDLLEYWKAQERMLPHLASVARQILAIPSRTVVPEEIFSRQVALFAARRSDEHMTPEVLEDLLYLSWYSQEAGYLNDVEVAE